MAAPSLFTAFTGTTDAGGAWTFPLGVAVINTNDVFILQVLQDGTQADTNITLTATNNVLSALDGTANTMTKIGVFDVGSAVAGRQHLWIGRSPAGADFAGSDITGGNAGTDDLYINGYRFQNVSTGTTLATVIENSSAGTATNGAGTGVTVSDTAVTTLAVDRLALNFTAITDNASGLAVFTGMSGGTWTNFSIFETATGTDGTVAYEDCTLATAGTIDGGTATITSLPWGVVGFALIGTTAGGTPVSDPTSWINDRRTPRRRTLQRM